jgi:hypothetical protein
MPKTMTYLSPFPRVCPCGHSHTQAEWEALPLVGYFYTPEDEIGPEEYQEWRNCECGSTIAVLVDSAKGSRAVGVVRA